MSSCVFWNRYYIITARAQLSLPKLSGRSSSEAGERHFYFYLGGLENEITSVSHGKGKQV